MQLSNRQELISQIVKENGPITGSAIASRLKVTRAALRSDLAILTMTGILDARPKVGYYYVGAKDEDFLADKIRAYKVGDYLSVAVAVMPSTSLYDTIVMMFTEDVGTLLVCEEGYLQGIVSRKDLLRATLGKNDLTSIPISMIMTPVSKLIFSTPNEMVIEAAQRMIDYEVDCLPVVEKEELNGKKKYKVLGRISKTSVTKLIVELGRA